MGLKLYEEPVLKNPIMFCGWPGIGNVGLVAMDTLRNLLRSRQFGEIEPFEFFRPENVVIKDGLLRELRFPESKFYFQRTKGYDVIFFIGQRQPTEAIARYAGGRKAYRMANLVLDVAEKFGCRRVYTSGAAVTHIHHTARPKVWAVPNSRGLIEKFGGYENTIFMSGVEGRGGQGVITGLNGLLLGVAKMRGFEAVCLMGEVPYYLQTAPWPYPKASKSVLEVLGRIVGIELDLSYLDELSGRIENSIERFLETVLSEQELPEQIKMEIEKLKKAGQADLGPITEEEKKKILEHIDELFKGDNGDEKRHL